MQVDGVSLGRLSRKQVAQRMAVVPQQFNIPFAYTVEDVVLLGRTPFIRGLASESKGDRQVVSNALELTGMSGFRGALLQRPERRRTPESRAGNGASAGTGAAAPR